MTTQAGVNGERVAGYKANGKRFRFRPAGGFSHERDLGEMTEASLQGRGRRLVERPSTLVSCRSVEADETMASSSSVRTKHLRYVLQNERNEIVSRYFVFRRARNEIVSR